MERCPDLAWAFADEAVEVSAERVLQMTQADSVEVKPSRVEGLGLFSKRAFDADDCIRRINVVREVTEAAPLCTDAGERFDHCDYVDGKVLLIGFPDRHLNHSCDPNAYVRYDAGASYIIARRHIEVGEEITCDYNINISGGTAWTCHCGATRCLGTVMGDFFLLPPYMQAEYRPLLAEWFVRKHRDRLKAIVA